MQLLPLSTDAENKVNIFIQELAGALTEQDGMLTGSAMDIEAFPLVWRWAIDQGQTVNTNGSIPTDLSHLPVKFMGKHYLLHFDELTYTISATTEPNA